MKLDDAHLKQALQHAPDRLVQPDAAVRDAVMAYARQAIHPAKPKFAFSALLTSFRTWPVAGLSSAALAMLAWVVVRNAPLDLQPVQQLQNEQRAQFEQALTGSSEAHAPAAASVEPQRSEVLDKVLPAKAKTDKSQDAVAQTPSPTTAKKAATVSQDKPITVPESKALETSVKAEQPESAKVTQAAEADLALPKPEMRRLEERLDSNDRAQVAASPALSAAAKLAPAKPLPLLLQNLLQLGGQRMAEQDLDMGLRRVLQVSVEPDTAVCQIDSPSSADSNGYAVVVIKGCEISAALQGEIERYNQVQRVHSP